MEKYKKFKKVPAGNNPALGQILPEYIHNSILLGPTGSGKSTAIKTILKYMAVPKKIRVQTEETGRKRVGGFSMERKTTKTHYRRPMHVFLVGDVDNFEKDTMLDILDSRSVEYSIHPVEEISKIIELCDSNYRKHQQEPDTVLDKKLIVLDDIDEDLKNNSDLSKFVKKCRHQQVQVLISCQYYTQVPPTVFSQMRHFCLFSVGENELKAVSKKLPARIKKEDFLESYHQATSEPYCFCLVDILRGEIRKDFDQVLI